MILGYLYSLKGMTAQYSCKIICQHLGLQPLSGISGSVAAKCSQFDTNFYPEMDIETAGRIVSRVNQRREGGSRKERVGQMKWAGVE